MSKITKGILLIGFVFVFTMLIRFDLLPQQSLLTCEDLQETQILLPLPAVYDGFVFTVIACGLTKEHTYMFYDIYKGEMNKTFTGVISFYAHYTLMQDAFKDDLLLQFWLFDVTTQEIMDTKILALKLIG